MDEITIKLTKDELNIIKEALIEYRTNKAKNQINDLQSGRMLNPEFEMIQRAQELMKINNLEAKIIDELSKLDKKENEWLEDYYKEKY